MMNEKDTGLRMNSFPEIDMLLVTFIICVIVFGLAMNVSDNVVKEKIFGKKYFCGHYEGQHLCARVIIVEKKE